MFAIFFDAMLGGVAFAERITGAVKKDAVAGKHQVIDAYSGAPISGATVTVPSKGFKVKTDANGNFELGTNIDKQVILSVEKGGYRPFSITIDSVNTASPMKLGIETAKKGDIVLESSLCHLGDDNYSANSANSRDFKAKSIGPFYTKRFDFGFLDKGEGAVLIIGSVIGLDTKMARELGQNAIASIYASPAEIFFNGQKIGELHLNGDNQEIPIPSQLIKPSNEVTIKTGRNLFQTAYVDYDDIEIMNIRVERRTKTAEYEKSAP